MVSRFSQHPHSGQMLLLFSSVQSLSRVWLLQPRGLQHARLPRQSPTPWPCSNSCPLSRWCHLTISSSVVPFSSWLQSFPASGSFLTSLLFASGGQSIEVSASAAVLAVSTLDWFPLGWTGWISLLCKGPKESSLALQFKRINASALSFLYSPTLTSVHDYWKNESFDYYGPLGTPVAQSVSVQY